MNIRKWTGVVWMALQFTEFGEVLFAVSHSETVTLMIAQ